MLSCDVSTEHFLTPVNSVFLKMPIRLRRDPPFVRLCFVWVYIVGI